MTEVLPGIDEIRAAAERLDGVAVRTPLLSSPGLDTALGKTVYVKAECLQITGSFKFRGAFNSVSQLFAPERAKGVIAYSSGNHAQAVAYAARRLGCAATIVMPSDAPRIKLEQTRAFGARVILYDRERESREDIAEALMREHDLTMIRPYDAVRTIAGQGTVGLEIAGQLRATGLEADAVLVPCGGGGLIAGTSTALRDAFPDLPVYSVEPEGFDDTARSLVAGRRLQNPPGGRTICDALRAPEPGALTFEVNRRTLAGGLAVGDAEVRQAMQLAFRYLKLVLEPGGAVALAALLSGKLPDTTGRVVVVASGGNIDADEFAAILASSDK